MWNSAAPEPDGDAADEAVGEAVATADALGLGLGGAAVGGALKAGAGAGPRNRIPPMTSAAAAIPVTRPATIDRRGHICAGAYQYERPAAARETHCYDAAPMSGLSERARTRFVPALLTAFGVTLLAAGLLSYTMPVAADPLPTASPAASAAIVTPAPRITLPPLASVGPTVAPSAPADRVATRVRVAALKIDLPVLPPGGAKDYPLCDAAQWLQSDALGQPGQGRAVYLYGHARAGMFLPLLTASKVKNGKRMLGMVVEVWTSDDQRLLYEITEVRRHVSYKGALDYPFQASHEQLWLQTSEGSGKTFPKLQVVAEPISQEPAERKAAHPKDTSTDCTPPGWNG